MIVGKGENFWPVVKILAELFVESVGNKNIETLYMGLTEAVELFTNLFSVLRVNYFNVLDTYAEINGIKDMLKERSPSHRIGDYYNNQGIILSIICIRIQRSCWQTSGVSKNLTGSYSCD